MAEESTHTEGVVVSEVHKPHFRAIRFVARTFSGFPLWVRLLTVLVVVAIILGIGFLSWWKFLDRDLSSGKNIDFTRVDPGVKKLNDASKPAEDGNTAGSIAAFDELINKETDSQTKAAYYRAKASLCASKEDYSCAIQANDQSLAITGDRAEELVASGDWAYASNNKEKGNDYYRRAIEVLKKSNTDQAKVSIQRLENIIAGKPQEDQGQ